MPDSRVILTTDNADELPQWLQEVIHFLAGALLVLATLAVITTMIRIVVWLLN